MKEYKVVIYQENAFSSFLFGSANVNPARFTELLNKNAEAGWRVVTMEREIRRLFLFWNREAHIVILERDRI
ncbi:MAG: DUF4177 domain-containing protein [Gilliamella sp.]|uniref:DUF4177 domain-containing protein n=1 Tax=Gilliamella TaxID=1193503 RepID=UPI00080DFE6B|nr:MULTISPECIES: DUF4177 domain-containing protein [Gilliamella]MCO6536839.1 DUF4177 domain-containing protein [Gilliamella sp.]MCO6540531.1 DUF4177 domain-containing protein [Gilliamella sp.]MCO6551280.1 DUF4177 domain-containing protein [Gilliamella sp.]MCO6555475.1 DUF4177 domain-containing protein [Gilliamella sp.]MCO6557662.1 DUF4177 domain-containing protein [Gilliamella sp.]